MPTSRPSSPATLSGSNALATKLRNAWLVDATSGSTVPDLTGAGPALSLQATPTYSAAAPLGRQLKGTGSAGVLASGALGNAITTINTYPWSMGAVFCYTGTKSGSSGPECIAGMGDDTTSSGAIFCFFVIDDGTYATTGNIVCTYRAVSGGSIRTIVGSSYSTGVVQAVSLHVDSTTVASLHIDGSIFTQSATTDAFGASGFGTYGMLAYTHNAGVGINFPASSNLGVAFAWSSVNAGVSDAICAAWTADPWIVLAAGAAGRLFRTNPSGNLSGLGSSGPFFQNPL